MKLPSGKSVKAKARETRNRLARSVFPDLRPAAHTRKRAGEFHKMSCPSWGSRGYQRAGRPGGAGAPGPYFGTSGDFVEATSVY